MIIIVFFAKEIYSPKCNTISFFPVLFHIIIVRRLPTDIVCLIHPDMLILENVRHCQKWKLWNYTSMDIKSIENWCNLDTVRKIKRYAKINGEWNHIVNFNRLCTNMNHSMPLCPNKDLHCNTIYGLTQHQKSAKTISGA